MEEHINTILDIVKNEKIDDKSNLEIEFRLGYFENNKFNSSLSEDFYNKINNNLYKNPLFKCIQTNTTDICYNDNCKEIKDEDTGKKIYMKKIRICNIDFYNEPFDLRVSISREIMLNEDQINKNKKEIIVRKKKRNSYKYKYWSYDLTKVTAIKNSVEFVNYEIELEIIDTSSKDLEYLIHSSLLKIKDLSLMIEDDSFNLVRK